MEKTLAEATETEIKALIYDQIIILEQAKTNISMLQQELDKRKNKTWSSSEFWYYKENIGEKIWKLEKVLYRIVHPRHL